MIKFSCMRVLHNSFVHPDVHPLKHSRQNFYEIKKIKKLNCCIKNVFQQFMIHAAALCSLKHEILWNFQTHSRSLNCSLLTLHFLYISINTPWHIPEPTIHHCWVLKYSGFREASRLWFGLMFFSPWLWLEVLSLWW